MYFLLSHHWFPWWLSGKKSTCKAENAGDVGSILGWEDPLEEYMVTHSSILSWRIPWEEEPGGLQSIGSQESDMTEATEHAPIITSYVIQQY